MRTPSITPKPPTPNRPPPSKKRKVNANNAARTIEHGQKRKLNATNINMAGRKLWTGYTTRPGGSAAPGRAFEEWVEAMRHTRDPGDRARMAKFGKHSWAMRWALMHPTIGKLPSERVADRELDRDMHRVLRNFANVRKEQAKLSPMKNAEARAKVGAKLMQIGATLEEVVQARKLPAEFWKWMDAKYTKFMQHGNLNKQNDAVNDLRRSKRRRTTIPQDMDARTHAFQLWMKQLFSTKRTSLLRYVRNPGKGSVHDDLTQLFAADSSFDGCTVAEHPHVSGLQAHQGVVMAMAELRALGRIKTGGLLVVHSTGAGKTLCALAILLAFWHGFGAANKALPVLFVSTNDNQQSNNIHKYARLAMLMFPDFEIVDANGGVTRPFARPPGAPHKYWDDPRYVDPVAARIKARLQAGIMTLMTKHKVAKNLTPAERSRALYTYATLGNDLENGTVAITKDTEFVCIVDEVQYLVSPPSSEPQFKHQYETVRKAFTSGRSAGKSWVVGMTATPGETKAEVVNILNAVTASTPRFNMTDSLAKMKGKAMGHVSYAYLLGDRSRFAQVRMRMMCSYLVDEHDRPSYYHDAYFLKLHRKFGAHPHYPSNAKTAVAAALPNTVPAPLTKTNGQEWPHSRPEHWTFDSTKTDYFHKPLRTLTIFAPLGEPELKWLKKRGEAEDDDNGSEGKRAVQQRTWPPQELFAVLSGPSDEPENSDDNTERTPGNEAVLQRTRGSASANVNGPRRSARQPGTPERVKHYLLSPKIPQFLYLVFKDLSTQLSKGTHGIHYVYTTDPMSARLIAHALERVLNMPQLKSAAAYRERDGPYFVMLDNLGSAVPLFERFKVKGRGAQQAMAGLRDFVSRPGNAYGQKVKVVVATAKSFKGVDLKNVRYLHLIDPLVNFRDFIQFVGRGPRYCSHSDHAQHQRFVEVILYRLMYSAHDHCPKAGAHLPDCFVWHEAYKRYFKPGQYNDIEDQVLWGGSVDYELFKDNLHKARGALRHMVEHLKCNTRDPITANTTPATNLGARGNILNGFNSLIRAARGRKRGQLTRHYAQARNKLPPLANEAGYASFKSTLNAKHKIVNNAGERMRMPRRTDQGWNQDDKLQKNTYAHIENVRAKAPQNWHRHYDHERERKLALAKLNKTTLNVAENNLRHLTPNAYRPTPNNRPTPERPVSTVRGERGSRGRLSHVQDGHMKAYEREKRVIDKAYPNPQYMTTGYVKLLKALTAAQTEENKKRVSNEIENYQRRHPHAEPHTTFTRQLKAAKTNENRAKVRNSFPEYARKLNMQQQRDKAMANLHEKYFEFGDAELNALRKQLANAPPENRQRITNAIAAHQAKHPHANAYLNFVKKLQNAPKKNDLLKEYSFYAHKAKLDARKIKMNEKPKPSAPRVPKPRAPAAPRKDSQFGVSTLDRLQAEYRKAHKSGLEGNKSNLAVKIADFKQKNPHAEGYSAFRRDIEKLDKKGNQNALNAFLKTANAKYINAYLAKKEAQRKRKAG